MLSAAPILAVDPGTTQSGWVVFDGERVRASGVDPNPAVLNRIVCTSGYVQAMMIEPHVLAVERFEARGMPIGDESIETILWTGRFVQAWHKPAEVRLIRRREVKLELCGRSDAKDPNVRQALLDRVGPTGTKRAPGPTYGVASHAWAALGVAVVAGVRDGTQSARYASGTQNAVRVPEGAPCRAS